MPPQNHLFSILFFVLFSFSQIQAHKPCEHTHRACSDDYVCSKDGENCHKKDDPNVIVKSRWGLQEEKCEYGNIDCGPNSYCLDYKPNEEKCVIKDISMCDSYLDFNSKSGCTNSSFLLKKFEDCSNYYLKTFEEITYQNHAISQCADLCTRIRIRNDIYFKKANCGELEENAVGNFSECNVQCGACFDQSTWPFILKKAKHWGHFSNKIGRDFAKKCHNEFMEKKGKWTNEEIKENSQKLVAMIFEYLHMDTSGLFGDLMELGDSSSSSDFKFDLSHEIPFHKQKFHFWHVLTISIMFVAVILILLIIIVIFVRKPRHAYEKPKRVHL